MINTANIKNNSIGYDVRKDDPTYNGYMALAYCIWGDVISSVGITMRDIEGNEEKIKKEFGLYKTKLDSVCSRKEENKTRKDKNSFLFINIELTDVNTGEVRKFDNPHQVAEFLKITTTSVGVYIRQNSLIKKQYRIKAERNKNYKRGYGCMKMLRVINIDTKEEIIFRGSKEAAEYIGVSKGSINWIVKNKRITKNGYKVERVEV